MSGSLERLTTVREMARLLERLTTVRGRGGEVRALDYGEGP